VIKFGPAAGSSLHRAQKPGCPKWPTARGAMHQSAFWIDDPSIAPTTSKIIVEKFFYMPSGAWEGFHFSCLPASIWS